MTWQRPGLEYCPVGRSRYNTLFITVVAPQLLHVRLPTDHFIIGPEGSKFWLGRVLYNPVFISGPEFDVIHSLWIMVTGSTHCCDIFFFFGWLLRYLSFFIFRPGNLTWTYVKLGVVVSPCYSACLIRRMRTTLMFLVSGYQLDTLDHSPLSGTWWGVRSVQSCFCSQLSILRAQVNWVTDHQCPIPNSHTRSSVVNNWIAMTYRIICDSPR